MIIIDWAHQKIHEGKSFYIWVEDDDLDSAATTIVAFKTGSKSIHLVFDVGGSAEGQFENYFSRYWSVAICNGHPIS